jgi:hypothetical protein
MSSDEETPRSASVAPPSLEKWDELKKCLLFANYAYGVERYVCKTIPRSYSFVEAVLNLAFDNTPMLHGFEVVYTFGLPELHKPACTWFVYYHVFSLFQSRTQS